VTRTSVTPLLELLDLEYVGADAFRGPAGEASPNDRVFGGLLIAQALVAAGRTVPPTRRPHSLHATFLHGASPSLPLLHRVERLRESRAFSTRQVIIEQDGQVVCTATVSFQDPEDGIEHQTPMPPHPEPEELPEWHTRLTARARYGPLADVEWSALDLRCDVSEASPRNPTLQVWLRSTAPLPDDPLLHAAVMAYASDLTLLAAVPLPDDGSDEPKGFLMATLEHSMWFLCDLRVDEWLLHDQMSPGASGARGLAWGRVYRADGRLVAATAQEGLLRPRTR
jgi:acyl-CoA thioesterase-2